MTKAEQYNQLRKDMYTIGKRVLALRSIKNDRYPNSHIDMDNIYIDEWVDRKTGKKYAGVYLEWSEYHCGETDGYSVSFPVDYLDDSDWENKERAKIKQKADEKKAKEEKNKKEQEDASRVREIINYKAAQTTVADMENKYGKEYLERIK